MVFSATGCGSEDYSDESSFEEELERELDSAEEEFDREMDEIEREIDNEIENMDDDFEY